MREYFDFILIGVTHLLLLHVKVPIYHILELRLGDRASLYRQQVIAESHVISSLCAVPLTNRLLLLTVYPHCFLVAGEVDIVVVGDGGAALRREHLHRAGTRPLLYARFLRENVHAEDLRGFVGVAVLASDTLGTDFLLDFLHHRLVLVVLSDFHHSALRHFLCFLGSLGSVSLSFLH